jgi:isopentenyldiphosphate isomerase
MQDELFDIVDENNNPLGITKSRSDVHRDGDWHRAVHIYVRNGKGEYLVHLRSRSKDLNPGKWDTKFGGHVLAGKDFDETAMKELEEEIGLRLAVDDLIRGEVYRQSDGTNNEVVQSYYYLYNGDVALLHFRDREVEDVMWMTAGKIIESLQKNPDKWSSMTKGFEQAHAHFQHLQSK